jgi:hypothetical protein
MGLGEAQQRVRVNALERGHRSEPGIKSRRNNKKENGGENGESPTILPREISTRLGRKT